MLVNKKSNGAFLFNYIEHSVLNLIIKILCTYTLLFIQEAFSRNMTHYFSVIISYSLNKQQGNRKHDDMNYAFPAY